MWVLIEQVGWAWRSCKLAAIPVLLVGRPHFEEQGFKDPLPHGLSVTRANFSVLRENNPTTSKENGPIEILG